jgi:hypothetical protein
MKVVETAGSAPATRGFQPRVFLLSLGLHFNGAGRDPDPALPNAGLLPALRRGAAAVLLFVLQIGTSPGDRALPSGFGDQTVH